MTPTEGGKTNGRNGDLRIAIVMPAYNAEDHLKTTLAAALEAAEGADLLVVDPGSDDRSAEIVREAGVRLISLGHRAGPAEARNAGVAAIDADVVLFVDSDCALHPEVIARVKKHFAAHPDLVALSGSYDDHPPHRGYASQYMNLRHHHTHHHAARENASFWAGCGAVRVRAFREAGGFDSQRYPRPMIEDIELGLRLQPLGACHLDPTIQATHLKRWSLRSLILTDIFCRAVPWTRLIKERAEMPNDLNLRRSQRIAALVSPLALLSIPALPILLWQAPLWSLLPLALILLSFLLSNSLILFFARTNGPLFAVVGWFLHQLHLFYSAATFTLVSLGTQAPKNAETPA